MGASKDMHSRLTTKLFSIIIVLSKSEMRRRFIFLWSEGKLKRPPKDENTGCFLKQLQSGYVSVQTDVTEARLER